MRCILIPHLIMQGNTHSHVSYIHIKPRVNKRLAQLGRSVNKWINQRTLGFRNFIHKCCDVKTQKVPCSLMGCRLARQRICGKTERHHSSLQCICCEFTCFLRVFVFGFHSVNGMQGSYFNTTETSDDSRRFQKKQLNYPIHLTLFFFMFRKHLT